METANINPSLINLGQETSKNYAQPDILCHTFDFLSNLHKLLPNHMAEVLHSYRSESDKIKCENCEFSGLEKILARRQLPKEVSLTPKPSKMPSWKRKTINNISCNWKKCHMWKKNMYEPPMCTIVARVSEKQELIQKQEHKRVAGDRLHQRGHEGSIGRSRKRTRL